MQLKQVAGRKLLFVMAAEAEYGVHLKERFVPLITGVGPVEAAVNISAALAQLAHEDLLPDLVISLGSAGSAKLPQTAVYQISSVSYRDMDASPLGFEKGVTPFADIPAVIDLPIRVTGIPEATLSTGANIISGGMYDEISEEMVDMETFAVQRACMHFAKPLIGLRGISDGAKELSHVSDWTEYLHHVDENLATAVDLIEAQIAEGQIL